MLRGDREGHGSAVGSYQRSLPSATQSLRLVRSTLGGSAGLAGAAMMVASEILSPDAVDDYLVAQAAAG